jgi:hypothetical protein
VGGPAEPPAEGYVTFVEYAARHGLPYNRVYDWVRWGACCLVRTIAVTFGLGREDRCLLAIGAVGWALAAAQFAGPGWRR